MYWILTISTLYVIGYIATYILVKLLVVSDASQHVEPKWTVADRKLALWIAVLSFLSIIALIWIYLLDKVYP